MRDLFLELRGEVRKPVLVVFIVVEISVGQVDIYDADSREEIIS